MQYGLDTGLLDEEDRYYARNQILRLLGLTEYEEPEEPEKKRSLEDILETLLDYAAENGLLEHDSVTYRDLFDTKLMNCLMPEAQRGDQNGSESFMRQIAGGSHQVFL